MTTGKHVALLRGINVGRAKRLAMADLRALVEELGYGDVRTLLNSGNVVFSASAAAARRGDAAARIEAAIAAKTGFTARVTVLSAAEVAAIARENPLLPAADDPARLLVTVLNDETHRERLVPLLKEAWEPEALALGPRVAYVWCGGAGGILESPVGAAIHRLLRDGVTSRNWATFLKLQALLEE